MMMRDIVFANPFDLVLWTVYVLVIYIFNLRVEVLLLALLDGKPIGCWARVHSLLLTKQPIIIYITKYEKQGPAERTELAPKPQTTSVASKEGG